MIIVFFVFENEMENILTYKNGKDVLPSNLLKQIQQYITGENIYIPTNQQERIGWGEKNGTKEYLINRNKQIYKQYLYGQSMGQLAQLFHLSKDSIKKIIYQMRKN